MSGVVAVSRATTSRPWTSASDPGVSSDSTIGVRVGDMWVNSSTQNIWICTSAAAGAAVWQHQTRILGASSAPSSVTGTLSQTTLATVVIPANAMGANGIITIEHLWASNGSANNKTFQINAGAALLLGSVLPSVGAYQGRHIWSNRNNTASQVWFKNTQHLFSATAGAADNTTSTVATTSSVTITFSGTLTNIADTLTLDRYVVTLQRP